VCERELYWARVLEFKIEPRLISVPGDNAMYSACDIVALKLGIVIRLGYVRKKEWMEELYDRRCEEVSRTRSEAKADDSPLEPSKAVVKAIL
jgi:hypothetical protein